MNGNRLSSVLITSAVAGALVPPITLIVFPIALKWKGAIWISIGYIFLVLIFEQTIVEMGNVSFIEYAIFMGLSGVVMGISSLVNGLGIADIYVVLQINGQNLLVVNLSHSMTKTSGRSLLSQVERYEKLTEQEVPTLQEMSRLVMDSLGDCESRGGLSGYV